MAGLLLAGSTYGQESTNSIVGIGLMLGPKAPSQAIRIEGTIPNSPAAVAGLMKGEMVDKIDGTSTADMDIKQCIEMIRGPAATTVTLEVVDPKDGATHVVTLTRETIALPASPAPQAPATPAPGP